jgi:hypothetical protein
MVVYASVICEEGHVYIYDQDMNIINRLGPWATIEEAQDFASEYVEALNSGTIEPPEEYWIEYPSITKDETTNS